MSQAFTHQELAQYNGTNSARTIYVAIKGTVFNVSSKYEMYGPGSGYHVFAGKDASRALGKSSLVPAECTPDYSDFNEKEQKTLDDWFIFFEKRYPIVGKVE
ncbi:cytochrome b5-like heme/steroid binding domain-containing protein [Dissophora ornata]|nr:hypothetical protein BGZ58_011057 [Dissophora ornata]KAI8595164.1 cytochrome b5-like heme/steroid binding domain-containing protein [Dissophora ornata]